MNFSKEQAIQFAMEDLGIEFPKESIMAQEIELPDRFIPFLHFEKPGLLTWQLGFQDLSPIYQDPTVGHIGEIPSIQVISNPLTGRILRLDTPWPEKVPNIAPYPSLEEEENQLNQEEENYTSFFELCPSITFFKALKIIDAEGMVSLRRVKQFIGTPIRHQTQVFGERNVWIIQTRGIPPLSILYKDAGPNDVPEDARNHMRHVVDSDTGEWLFSDTVPQPV